MNLELLHTILNETTVQLRKGDAIVDNGNGSTSIFMMPNEAEAPETMKKVDCFFITVGVDMEKAEARRAEFVQILSQYPEPERLADGQTYIEVGAALGDQGAAFMMFALGEALGLWRVITPTTVHITGEQAVELAGRGFIVISGYK
jgi:hypothetical protein